MKSGRINLPTLFFYIVVLAILGPLITIQILKSACQLLHKKPAKHFIWDCIESNGKFENLHLNNIKSSKLSTWYIFIYIYFNFSNDFWVSMYRSCPSLSDLFLNISHFWCFCNGINLISISSCLLLLYRNKLCVLYYSCLLSSLSSSNNCFCGFNWTFYINNHVFCK